jgi:O-methyltransferase involved in polyketide biosynthesis
MLGSALSDISETLLITLYCRALETKTKDPVLLDPKAVEIAEKLNPELSVSEECCVAISRAEGCEKSSVCI